MPSTRPSPIKGSILRRLCAIVAIAVLAIALLVAAAPLRAGAATAPPPGWTNVTPPLTNPPTVGGDTVYDPGTGQLLLVQGADQGVETWVWTGAAWTSEGVSNPGLDVASDSLNVAYDVATSQLVLVAGGTFVWTGTTWNEVTTTYPNANPLYTSTTPLAYDAASNQLIAVVGNPSDASNPVIPTQTWEWTGSTWTQLSPETAPPPRFSDGLAYDPAISAVVLFGGQDADGNYLSDTWLWDGNNWSEVSTTTSPTGRTGALMAYDNATSQFLLYGGGGDTSDGGYQTLEDTWVFSGTDWTAESPSTTPDPGVSVSDDLATGQLVLFATAADDEGYTSATTWTWDGSNWNDVTPAPTSPPSYVMVKMAYDSATNQLIAVANNSLPSAFVPTNSTYEWEDGSWTELSGAQELPGWGAISYDAAAGQLIYYNEDAASGADATWEWNGSNWTQLSSASSFPPPLNGEGSLVYDSTSGALLLVGPFLAGDSQAEETWQFDGTSWTQLSAGAEPPGVSGAAVADDPGTGGLVLYGGSPLPGGSPPATGTWEFDGTSWTEMSPPASPPGLSDAAMAYDPTTASLVMFGGSTGPHYSNETWTFDGTSWSELSSPADPSARIEAGMAWDPATSQMLLTGGEPVTPPAEPADTWEIGTTQQPVPIITSVTAGDTALEVAWTPPDLGPGVDITGYVITAEPGGIQSTVSGPVSSGGIGGLTNGVAYTVAVAPITATGTYPASASSAAVVPVGPPNPPNGYQVTAGDGSVEVTWGAAGTTPSAGPVTGYEISYLAQSPQSSWQDVVVGPNQTSYDLTGLVNGMGYDVNVTSVGQFGDGYIDGSLYAVPYASVSAPAQAKGVSNGGSVTLNWKPATPNKDGPVTGYEVLTPTGATKVVGATATSATLASISDPDAPGFKVSAITKKGLGPPASVTPHAAVPPTAPRGLHATAGPEEMSLSWSPPTSNGGDALSDYVVTVTLCTTGSGTCKAASVHSDVVAATSTSKVITGLLGRRRYEFTVTAKTEAGPGPATAPVTGVPQS